MCMDKEVKVLDRSASEGTYFNNCVQIRNLKYAHSYAYVHLPSVSVIERFLAVMIIIILTWIGRYHLIIYTGKK